MVGKRGGKVEFALNFSPLVLDYPAVYKCRSFDEGCTHNYTVFDRAEFIYMRMTIIGWIYRQ